MLCILYREKVMNVNFDIGIEKLFQAAAWQMIPWSPYSVQHITLSVMGIFFAWLAARKFSSHQSFRVLFSCGILLSLMELYKQGFLYFIVNSCCYDWWYFPFQLCSIPMYLCLMLPFIRSQRIYRAVMTFLRDYSLLGGFPALAVPPGLIHPYWTLTLHGFFWHFILIFIGLFCTMCDDCRRSEHRFADTLPIFFCCCAIAFFINTVMGPEADADMFYISPYHPSSQPVFDQISLHLGIMPGIVIYLAAVLCGGFLVHVVCEYCHKYIKRG